MSQELNSDCLQIIFSNLKEISALYSCSLVNKHWNENAIPYLWENPFRYLNWVAVDSTISKNLKSIKNIPDSTGNVMRESTLTSRRCENLLIYYLYFIEDEEKEMRRPLFNYSKYLKCLDIDRIINTIKTFLLNNEESYEIDSEKVQEVLINLLSVFTKYSKNIIKISFDSTFQENNSMILSTFSYLKNKYEIENRNLFKEFLSSVKEFEHSTTYPSDDVFKLLCSVSSNIKTFTINMGSQLCNNNNGLSEFIRTQHSITELNFLQVSDIVEIFASIFSNNCEILNIFDLFPNTTNSIKKISIHNLFYMCKILKKCFNTLEDLELEFEEFDPKLNLELMNCKFIKLKYLKIKSHVLNEEFVDIILNSGSSEEGKSEGLEYISIETWNSRNNNHILLLDAILNHQNLSYLHIPIVIIDDESIKKSRILCESCKNLRFLRLDSIIQPENKADYSNDMLKVLKESSNLNVTKFELFGWWNLLPENIKEFIDYRKSLGCYFKLYIDSDLSGISSLSSYFNDEILILPY